MSTEVAGLAPNEDLSSLGSQVKIGNIERELAALWRDDHASSKASLINLVIYSEQEGALESNSEIVREITREHACRALLVEAHLDTDEPSAAKAWITAHCNLIGGGKSVCSEQIAFELVGKATGRIRNIVFAHLVSDLPLVFWWQGDLSRIFDPDLTRHLDRLVIDSSEWTPTAMENHLRQLVAAMTESRGRFSIHDISWVRSQQMRLAFAMLFDSEAAQAALAHPRLLSIAGSYNTLPTMLLLVVWIARALGWSLVKFASGRAFYKSREGFSVEVGFCNTGDSVNCPAVSSISLECDGSHFEASLEPGCRYISATGSIGDVLISHLVPAGPHKPAALLSNLLAWAGDSQLYLPSLSDLIALSRGKLQ